MQPYVHSTCPSLLQRLRVNSSDMAAWTELVRKYSTHIYGWCLRWRLQPSDAEDVTQNVLLRLSERIRHFEYDPSKNFRAYVKTLARYAYCDFLKARSAPGQGSGDEKIYQCLNDLAADDDLETQLASSFDQELLEEAMLRVAQRVEPHTWAAFRLQAIEGLSGEATAARLNITLATAYKARSKVQRMLQEAVQELERDAERSLA